MARLWCERVLLIGIARYKLNIWDVGGQKTIRSYWRNYFEKTDALIWVVDATDRLRVGDCRDELKSLLLEEVQHLTSDFGPSDNPSCRDWRERACWCS